MMKTDGMLNNNDIYYFPRQTSNIMFVKGQKYVYIYPISYDLMSKGQIYTFHNFDNNEFYSGALSNIEFIDNFGKIYSISPYICGYFISLKKYRKKKLEQLKKASI